MADGARGAASAMAPVLLGPSQAFAEGGRALVWDVRLWGQPARAFALRHGGRLVGYINRCAHVPAELDWQPGEFLDAEQRFIVCSIHGALYEPASGRCVGGPCGRGRLIPLTLAEADGQAHWYPSQDVQPVVAAAQAPPPAPQGGQSAPGAGPSGP